LSDLRGLPCSRAKVLARAGCGASKVSTHVTGFAPVTKITTSPMFRKANRGVIERARLTTDAVRQILLKRAAREPAWSARVVSHDRLRRWCPGRRDRHRSQTTMRSYVRGANLSREPRWDRRLRVSLA